MITGFYAAILAFIYIGLTIHVIRGRFKYKIGLGDAGNMDLNKRIRLHGNFAEYAPFGLLLLFLVDLSNAPALIVHGLGSMLVAGRLLHIYGLNSSPTSSFGRPAGMALTMIMMALSSILLIWNFLPN